MVSRREFLSAGAAFGALAVIGMPAAVRAATGSAKGVTVITQVFGEGQKLVAVAIGYEQVIDNGRLDAANFAVEGRTVTRAYANTGAALAPEGVNGRFVILELSLDDETAALYATAGRDVIRREAKATVMQTGPVATVDGGVVAAVSEAIPQTAIVNPIVDDFLQLEYSDAGTGDSIGYNLFIPKNYDPAKSYPLVLFMHDAGATSDIVTTTLVQGLGALCWASPEDQAKREAFVLAPQFASQVVNDQSEATSLLDTTINLVKKIAADYSIDTRRLYNTGQSGGAMMSIAMNIKYPDFFAATYLVAGQWDPTKVAPLAGDRMWVVVSEGDAKAYPTENAMMEIYEKEGAKISRAVWEGSYAPEAFTAAFDKVDAAGSAINYIALKKGTVVPPGQTDDPGANHVNTWRIAYTIDDIRDWIFRQSR